MMDESNTQPENEQPTAAAADENADGGVEAHEGAISDSAADAVSAGAEVAAQGVKAPAFEDLDEALPAAAGAHPSLDIVLDVPVTISLEVGKATMTVGELIRLGQGAVVELDRAVGEPLDVMVNGALVAHGEIVLVNEKFGIRLTSVVASAGEQIKEAG